MQLIPHARSSISVRRPSSREMAAREHPAVIKAARKSAGPALSAAERTLPSRQRRQRQAPPVQKLEFGPSGSLVKPGASTRSASFRIDELPFPFSLKIVLNSLLDCSIPFPCLVTHQFELQLRHDCQSTEQATLFNGSSSVSEYLESAQSLSPVTVPVFLVDYPPLPLKSGSGTVPQRSGILLRYRMLSSDRSVLFETSVPLSKERRIDRAGLVKSKRSLTGATAIFRWQIEHDREEGRGGDALPDTDRTEVCRSKLETRLQELEQEWREEVVERESAQQRLSQDSRLSSLRDLPTSFKRTPSLLPGLDSHYSDSNPATATLPPFLPIPKYEFVEFANRAISVTGRSFEVFPQLNGWEDAQSTNGYVDEQSVETMAYEAESSDDEEKIRQEEAWNKANLVSRSKLEGLNPGRVHRDFTALDQLFELLNLDRDELARRIQSDGESLSWTEALKDESVVAQLCREFEERLGISLKEVQQNSRSNSEREIVAQDGSIDRCEFCGSTLCNVHPLFCSYNAPLSQPETVKKALKPKWSCSTCKDGSCKSRKIRSSAPEPVQKAQLQQLVQDFPNLNPCTASIVLERSLDEITEFFKAYRAKEPKTKPQTTIPSLKQEKWRVQASGGYTPCECKDSCDKECPCRASPWFCDRFCGCPPNCSIRYRGCDCHDIPETAGPNYRCCVLKHENECPCRVRGRACDPRICSPCGQCANMQLSQVESKSTIATVSEVPDGGYGLVALESIPLGSTIGAYAGESFAIRTRHWNSNGYGPWKGAFSERARISFWFNLDQEHAIDSQEIGNLTRFINHREKKEQCTPTVLYIDGANQITLTATSSIKPGEELYLDYGKEYTGSFIVN
ncbi:hypothetical protein JCM5350_003342 [Sporobolomyces pararoseus]